MILNIVFSVTFLIIGLFIGEKYPYFIQAINLLTRAKTNKINLSFVECQKIAEIYYKCNKNLNPLKVAIDCCIESYESDKSIFIPNKSKKGMNERIYNEFIVVPIGLRYIFDIFSTYEYIENNCIRLGTSASFDVANKFNIDFFKNISNLLNKFDKR